MMTSGCIEHPFFLVPYGTRQCHQLQIFTVQIVASAGLESHQEASKLGDETDEWWITMGSTTWGAPKQFWKYKII